MGIGPRHYFERLERRLVGNATVDRLPLRQARSRHGDIGTDQRSINCETTITGGFVILPVYMTSLDVTIANGSAWRTIAASA